MQHGLATAAFAAAFLLAGSVLALQAQDMIDQLDLKSDEFTKADVTRDDIVAAIAATPDGSLADFSGKRLNGLDLSGLDLRKLRLQSTRINGAKLAGANLDGVILDQAWALESDLTNAIAQGREPVLHAVPRRQAGWRRLHRRPRRRRFLARQPARARPSRAPTLPPT